MPGATLPANSNTGSHNPSDLALRLGGVGSTTGDTTAKGRPGSTTPNPATLEALQPEQRQLSLP